MKIRGFEVFNGIRAFREFRMEATLASYLFLGIAMTSAVTTFAIPPLSVIWWIIGGAILLTGPVFFLLKPFTVLLLFFGYCVLSIFFFSFIFFIIAPPLKNQEE